MSELPTAEAPAAEPPQTSADAPALPATSPVTLRPAPAPPAAANPVELPRSPLRRPLFRDRWIAALLSNTGSWMQDTAATWLMASLTTSPFLIALMQTAASLPVLFLGLPAGAIADILDRRRLLIFWQFWMLAAAVLLSVITLAGWMGPWTLLTLTLVLSIGAAMNNPAWQAIVPELVPRSELAEAISLNSAGYNLARAVGPALGGMAMALFATALTGAGFVFFVNALSFAFVILMLYQWKRQPLYTSELPAERLLGSMRAGIRYVRHARDVQTILIRTFLLTSCVSAMWALLAVVAQRDLARGALGYGLLNASIGTGAVLGAVFLPRLRRRVSDDVIVAGSSIVFAATLLVMAFLHQTVVIVLVLLAAGFAWTSTTSSFNIAVQVSVPNWVKARTLGMYQMTFQAGMALGAAAWGWVAEHTSTPIALSLAAAGLLAGLPAAWRFRLTDGETADLDSAQAKGLTRAAPAALLELMVTEPEDGPLLISVEYRIDPLQASAFISAIHDLKTIRLRDGGMRWALFADAANPARYVETFLVESWAEYLRQRERLTVSDLGVRERVFTFQQGSNPPSVSRMVYVPTSDAPGPPDEHARHRHS
jgi:MFS family permease